MKKIKILTATILLSAVLSGCSTGDTPMTNKASIRTQCLNGVVYYLSRESAGYTGYGYMAPKYNRDGSLSLCDNY